MTKRELLGHTNRVLVGTRTF